MKRNVLTAILAGALAAGGLFAGQIREREKNQQQRIRQGVVSGELTRREAARLQKREANLHRDIVRDVRDGPGLTARERAKIHARQDKLSRDIAREKHDAQKRP